MRLTFALVVTSHACVMTTVVGYCTPPVVRTNQCQQSPRCRTRPSMISIPSLGRFRKRREVLEIPNQIEVGSSLPEVDVEVLVQSSSNDAPCVETSPMSITEALGDGTAILVGMPGAFTPTCNSKHLPEYIDASTQLKSMGVDKIAVVTTNDRFVLDAWAKNFDIVASRTEGDSKVTMISDGDGDLVRALGLAEDMGFGVGIRSKRFALISKGGKVSHVGVDEGMDELSASSAESITSILTPAGSGSSSDVDGNVISVAIGCALLLAATYFASHNLPDISV